MRTIDATWFWYVLLGIILGGGLVYLAMKLKEKAIRLAWYEWLLNALVFVILLLMGQTFIASFNEGEPQAAWMSLVFMGIPAVLLAVLSYRLVYARLNKLKSVPAAATAPNLKPS